MPATRSNPNAIASAPTNTQPLRKPKSRKAPKRVESPSSDSQNLNAVEHPRRPPKRTATTASLDTAPALQPLGDKTRPTSGNVAETGRPPPKKPLKSAHEPTLAQPAAMISNNPAKRRKPRQEIPSTNENVPSAGSANAHVTNVTGGRGQAAHGARLSNSTASNLPGGRGTGRSPQTPQVNSVEEDLRRRIAELEGEYGGMGR